MNPKSGKPILYLSPPHMEGKEREFLLESFDSNWIAPLGPFVDRFETDIAAYTGAKAASVFTSGTAAIHLALILSGVKAGDEVIVSDLTFVGSVSPVMYLDAKPVFIDSEPKTWNLDPVLLEEFLFRRQKECRIPKALILVHLYGTPALLAEIIELCEKYSVTLIEDAAESLGGLYKGRHTGGFGKFGILSFNGNKIITTSGGGALISDDMEAIARSKFLATQAREPVQHYEHKEIGYNYRLSNLLAALGVAQMETIERKVSKCRDTFEKYRERLRGHSVGFQSEPNESRSNRWLTVGLLPEGISPERVIKSLSDEGVESRSMWKPMHMQPVFKGLEFVGSGTSKRLYERGIALPSGTNIRDEDINRVSELVIKHL
jgi:dTDP-4-amino-4,6-dideoxygalactose transaminase